LIILLISTTLAHMYRQDFLNVAVYYSDHTIVRRLLESLSESGVYRGDLSFNFMVYLLMFAMFFRRMLVIAWAWQAVGAHNASDLLVFGIPYLVHIPAVVRTLL
jgi:hypothetical protein